MYVAGSFFWAYKYIMWQEEMITVLRVLINDMDEETYSDDRLTTVLLVGARSVLQRAEFTQDFEVDIVGETITPDPTDSATRDNSFINLVCLKSACLIDRAQSVTWATQAVAGRDGFSSFDLRGVAASKIKLLEVGWCAVYESELLDYLSNSTVTAGAAIMGPFRTLAGYGPSNYWNMRANDYGNI